MPRRRMKSSRRKKRTSGGGGRTAMAGPRDQFRMGTRSNGGRPLTSPRRTLNAFPERLKCTLRYDHILTMTGTSGAIALQEYRGNSVFDPDATGTGDQPVNFDDLSVHYDRYVVWASKITITAANGSNNNIPFIVTLVPYFTLPSNSMKQYIAQPFSQTMVVSSVAAPITISNRMMTSRMFGTSPASVKINPNFAAQTSANPSEQWFWGLVIQDHGATASIIVDLIVVIEYDVEFFERPSANLDSLSLRIAQVKAANQARIASKLKLRSGIMDTKVSFSADSPATTKVLCDEKKGDSWSDIDDSDEATFAEFLAWKTRTGAKPLQERTAGGLLGPELQLRTPTSTVAGTSGGSIVAPIPLKKAGIG